MSAFRLLGFDPLQRQSIGPYNKNQFKATQKEKAQSVNQIVDPGSTRKEAEDFRVVENHFNQDIFEFALKMKFHCIQVLINHYKIKEFFPYTIDNSHNRSREGSEALIIKLCLDYP